MEKISFITGADRGLGFALASLLLQNGWRVFAGQYLPDWPELPALAQQHPNRLTIVPLDVASTESVQAAARQVAASTDHIDLLVNNAGITSPTMYRNIREPQDYAEMHRIYDTNSLGPLRMVEAFLPLVERGELKRLCFVSSEAGSVGRARRESWFGYCMSKAALNMAVKILFNNLRPQGFTFRLYHPGWVRSYMSGKKNLEADLEPEQAAQYALAYFLSTIDEDTLALVDYQGQVWPW